MRRKNTKILAFGLAALLAASNVVPALAAYHAPGRAAWQGSLNMDSAILKRSITAGSRDQIGSGSETEEPTQAPTEGETSAGESTEGSAESTEESTESTDSTEESTESTAPAGPEESTEAVEKPEESEEESEGAGEEYRPASGSEIPNLFRAGGFVLEKEEDLKAAFPDAKLRKVVFDAIVDWEDDTGETCAGADIEEALARFTGDIKASNKGIKDITGVRLLVNAGTVNLSRNEIKDWRPAAGGSKEHYGHGSSGDEESTNVTWIIDRNPFTQLPYSFGGRLVIEQPATHAYTYPYDASQNVLSFVRRADEAGRYFDAAYDIGRCEIEEEGSGILEPAEIISVAAVKGTWDKPIMSASKADNTTANLSRIMKSGTQLIGIGVDQILRYDTVDEFNTSTPGKQSFKYYLQAKVAVYDSVSVEQTPYRGSVVLTKVESGNSSKKLSGAAYELVRGTPDAPGEVVCERTTDAQGTITVLNLEPGRYFFRETKAPDGYLLNPDVKSFEVFNRDVRLGGGSTTAQDGAATVRVADSNHERFIAGPTGYGNGTPDITLSLVPGSAAGDLPLLGKARYEVTYSSIGASPDNVAGEQLTKTFYMPEEAAADINKYKQDNRITGPVKIKVTFEKTAAGAIAISTTDIPAPGVRVEPTTELSGTKVWKDEPGYTGLHPDVIIHVYRKGDRTKTPVRSLTLHDGQEAFKFYDLPKYDSGQNEIQYEVEEEFADPAERDNFYVSQTGNTITNTFIAGKIDIEGKKGWNAEGWEAKAEEEPVHPTITIDLYRNGSYHSSCTITPDKDSYRFADLDLRDSKGRDYKYTVRERAVADWTSYARNTYDFENVFTPGTPPSNPPSNGSHGGGGGGGNPPSPRPNVPPTPYGPGTTPPEEVPPTPGLPPETPPETPEGQTPQAPDSPAPLPRMGEARIPAYYLIFLSGSFTMAIYVTNIGKREEEEI